ncbi:MAG: hypothetical protein ABH951_01625 [Patescibacteria group bacterium]
MKKNIKIILMALAVVFISIILIFSFIKNKNNNNEKQELELFIVTSSDTQVTLKIPQDLLPKNLSLEDISITRVEDDKLVYKLEPAGIKFDQPVSISVRQDIGEQNIPMMFHLDDENYNIVNNTKVTIDEVTETTTITGEIEHFSYVWVGEGLFISNRLQDHLGEKKTGETFTLPISITNKKETLVLPPKETGVDPYQLISENNPEVSYLGFRAKGTDGADDRQGNISPRWISKIEGENIPFENDEFSSEQEFYCMKEGEDQVVQVNLDISYDYSHDTFSLHDKVFGGKVFSGEIELEHKSKLICTEKAITSMNINTGICGKKIKFTGQVQNINNLVDSEILRFRDFEDYENPIFASLNLNQETGELSAEIELPAGGYSYDLMLESRHGDDFYYRAPNLSTVFNVKKCVEEVGLEIVKDCNNGSVYAKGTIYGEMEGISKIIFSTANQEIIASLDNSTGKFATEPIILTPGSYLYSLNVESLEGTTEEASGTFVIEECKPVPLKPEIPQTGCYDTDGGNRIFEKGSVSFGGKQEEWFDYYDQKKVPTEDYCRGPNGMGGDLVEFSCTTEYGDDIWAKRDPDEDRNYLGVEFFNCWSEVEGTTCKGGACVNIPPDPGPTVIHTKCVKGAYGICIECADPGEGYSQCSRFEPDCPQGEDCAYIKFSYFNDETFQWE